MDHFKRLARLPSYLSDYLRRLDLYGIGRRLLRALRLVLLWAGSAEGMLLIGLTALAATLRLSHLDLIEFKMDEAKSLQLGLELAQGSRFPLVGSLSSYGFHKPPMMTYLLAFPLLLGRDPRIASAFIAILNAASVCGVYLIVSKYYGKRQGIITALLLAANPWAVLLSRKVFTADILLPFLVLCFWGLCRAILDSHPDGWPLAVVSLGVALNITFSPLPLLLALVALLVVYRDRVSWPHLLLGVCVVLLLFAPYLYYQQYHRFQGVREALGDLFSEQGGEEIPLFRSFQFACWLHSGGNLQSLAGAAAGDFAIVRAPLQALVTLASGLFYASIPGLGLLALRACTRWKEREDPAKYLIPAAWVWGSLLVTARQPGHLEPHYLVILNPCGYLGMGLLMERGIAAAQEWKRLGRWRIVPLLTMWTMLLVLACWHSYSVIYTYKFVTEHDTSGGYGVPYRFWQRTAEMVRREAREMRVREVWILAQGTDPLQQDEPAVLRYLLEPDLSPVFLGQGGKDCLPLPAARPGLYLKTRPSPPAEEMLNRLEADPRGVVLFPGRTREIRVLYAGAIPAERMLDLIPERDFAKLDYGPVFLGYEWQKDAHPGSTALLTTFWTFDQLPPQERGFQHSLFNHLLNSEDRKIAQEDGLGLPERYWSRGLLIAQWFELSLPPEMDPGEYRILTGMYRLKDNARSPIGNAQGEKLGDSISLRPIRVLPEPQ